MFSLPEPTNLRRIQFGELALLKYVKPLELPSMGVYRSVVTRGDAVLSVAPPRALPLEDFIAQYPFETVRLTEFVDGTMVNMFYTDKWCLSTKSNIGASNGFLEGSPCFAEMFWEATAFMGVALDVFDRSCTYSFVLQHPKNRIVTPVKAPSVVMVQCARIAGREVTLLPLTLGPTPFHAASYADVKTLAELLPYTCKGVMLHAPDGARAKVMGHAYLQVSALRGSDASINFRLLQLRDRPELAEFIQYYPEYAERATNTQGTVRRFANELYSMYIDCYRHKTKPLKEYPREFKPHLYGLHQLYLAAWPKPIHKKRVVEYVASLHAAQLCVALKH